MGKKKAIGLDGRLSILAQALIDYAEEGGQYSVEVLATGEGADGLEPAGVAIALWGIDLERVPEKDGSAPAYRLVYCGEGEGE